MKNAEHGNGFEFNWAMLIRQVVQSGIRSSKYAFAFTLFSELLVALSIPVSAVGIAIISDSLLSQSIDKAIVGSAILSAALAAQWVVGGVGARLRMTLIEKTGLEFEKRLVDAVLSVKKLNLFLNESFSDKIFLAKDQVAKTGYAINSIVNASSQLIRAIVSVLILVSIDPSWIFLVVAGGIMSFGTIKAEKIEGRAQLEAAISRRMARTIGDSCLTINAISQINVWNSGESVRNRVNSLNQKYISMQSNAMRSAFLWRIVTGGIFCLFFSLLVFSISANNSHSVSEIAVFAILGMQLSGILYGVSQTTGAVRGSLISVSRICEIEAIARTENREITSTSEDGAGNGLVLSNVSFTYEKSDTITLDKLTLDISRGQVLGIVGRNGSGKTTLAMHLLGLLNPDAGVVKLEEGRKVTATFQDFIRPSFKLKDVVGIGSYSDTWTDQEVLRSLQLLGLVPLIDGLPDGLSTQLGTQLEGHEFSGGIWQQLALARSLMRDSPDVLLLDEPTASVDPDKEHAILELLRGLISEHRSKAAGITVVVSHRLSLMTAVDRIIVLSEGVIVEDGSHHDLIGIEDGHYKTLFDAQADSYR